MEKNPYSEIWKTYRSLNGERLCWQKKSPFGGLCNLLPLQGCKDCDTIWYKGDYMFKFEKDMPDITYSVYSIRKKNGKRRIITAPNDKLKQAQYEIMRYLNTLRVSEYAHGFVENRSILTNAVNHTNKNFILNIDMKDFFPSIKRDKVQALFKKLKLSKKAVDVVLYNDCLPQGSPCSPVISNLVCLELDEYMGLYAKSKGFTYSRYADDLTFSSDDINQDNILEIYSIIESFGFVVNTQKTSLLGQGQRQMVTGLVVNKKVNIPRKMKRRLRAMKHQYETLTQEEKEFLAGWNSIEKMIENGSLK